MGSARSREQQQPISSGVTWPPPPPVYPLAQSRGPCPPLVPPRKSTYPDNYLPPCGCKTCKMAVMQEKIPTSTSVLQNPKLPSPPTPPTTPTPPTSPPQPASKQEPDPCGPIQKSSDPCCPKPVIVMQESQSCPRTTFGPMTDFHKECLNAHNQFRAKHRNCPPLTLSRELCEYAEQWAKKLADTGRLEHRTVHTYGENLFVGQGTTVDGCTPVKCWYDEIRYYDYSLPRFTPGTGHFSQVVWRDSKQLGVGCATKNGCTYVVCNYNPYGNVAGQFEYNVTPCLCPT